MTNFTLQGEGGYMAGKKPDAKPNKAAPKASGKPKGKK
jgi:hypothetical protein